MLEPIDLIYVCGNKFLVTNSTPRLAQVAYRVSGSSEAGSLTLEEGPGGDPGHSETELETRERGAVELYQDDVRVARRRNDGIPCGAAAVSTPLAAAGSDASAGRWTSPFAWPIISVHLHLLSNGKVLSWGEVGEPYLWDPASKVFTVVPVATELFCSGHTLLADGRLLVTGGHYTDDHGLPDVNLFQPSTGTWASAPPMPKGRWYPTSTTLANGEVVTLAGKDLTATTVQIPDVWTGNGWRALTGASRSLPYYPRTFLAPNGRVFYAGERQATAYLSTSGSGGWSSVGNRLYGTRDYGAAVMYEPGKVLYIGGGRTTNTAETIDLNEAAPVWRWTGSMAYPRRHLNATMLPTGEVLVTGGTGGTAHTDESLAVYAAEVWDPSTGVWTTLASASTIRGYHSTAVLLPSGEVLVSGSGDSHRATDQRSAELFSPPYLFKGARPTITSAPSRVAYGSSFSVETPEADDIGKVSLIRLGSTTHAFNMNQRFQWLAFTRGPGVLSISVPSNRNLTPPGHYMLFILDRNGVPSTARIVQVGSQSDPTPSPITLSVTGIQDATTQYMKLTWSGAGGDMMDVYRNGVFLKATENDGKYTNSRKFTGAATYVYKLCQAGTATCSNEASVTFDGVTLASIVLSVSGRVEADKQYMTLSWTGATGTMVDVYRNGVFLKATENDGKFTNSRSFTGAATYVYKVCQTGTTTCSNEATVTFS